MRLFYTAAFLIFFVGFLHAQSFDQVAKNAYLVTRMAAKYHVNPKPLNDVFSVHLLKAILHNADDDRIYFLKEDVDVLAKYANQLDDEIKFRKSNFLNVFISIFQQRLKQADSIITVISKTPFNINLSEQGLVKQDTSYAKDLKVLHKKLQSKLTGLAIEYFLDANIDSLSEAQLKTLVQKSEPVLRKKATSTFKRNIHKILHQPGGLITEVEHLYCKSIALLYDPHTEYLPEFEKENLESDLGKQRIGFGFSLTEDEEDITIEKLVPGSAAFKSGQINKGDKILSIKWGNEKPIDVTNADLQEVWQLLQASNHDMVVLKIKKTDGTIKEVSLWKEEMDTDDDEGRVKSFVLKGGKNTGYICLPAFYFDWENSNGINGCANDVAKEILKLKKENIDGLILDIRYNGGGSLQEAIELAGIFIDAGPLAQEKAQGDKIITLKDVTRGTIYDGPLMVLVNGFSASASEILTGILQDYNRALIVGTNTYGKFTAQVVLPLDTSINLSQNYTNIEGKSYLKTTVAEIYRITGNASQGVGVEPHIKVPDILDVYPEREKDMPWAIKSLPIQANKYYKPLPPLSLNNVKTIANREIASSPYFKGLGEFIQTAKEKQLMGTSLSVDEIMKLQKIQQNMMKETASNTVFSVENHSYDKQRQSLNAGNKKVNRDWAEHIQSDPYIKLAYQLMQEYSKNYKP